MKVYLVPKANLSGLAMTSHPHWEIPTPPAAISLFQLRNFILNQAITITHLSQIAPENLPYLVVDSPAWLASVGCMSKASYTLHPVYKLLVSRAYGNLW